MKDTTRKLLETLTNNTDKTYLTHLINHTNLQRENNKDRVYDWEGVYVPGEGYVGCCEWE